MTEPLLDVTPHQPGAARPEAPDFRDLMSTFPTGVAVVTTAGRDGRPWGMTCSSVTSITTDPPTLLVSLRRGSPTLSAVLECATFAVNLLHHEGRPAAELFASGDPDRFDRVAWRDDGDAAGPHLLDHAHSVADCRVERILPVGDHTVVFGEVFRIETYHSGPLRPLLYGLRQYRSWSTGDRKEGEVR
ncbi:flavin reductase family protein [Streptomyces sp. TRM68367]|uniref:flavin reductase family protein n=1 Tax=Streptomyces sp. TRM68367 TaxID=2758415 RepID=UPI00165B58CD|nr:flavin reductase family protein [Streptomyces sp. TRM68367]MBC9727071.1 flavin reductase family protein [Streptomyces sp. TRM68367]